MSDIVTTRHPVEQENSVLGVPRRHELVIRLHVLVSTSAHLKMFEKLTYEYLYHKKNTWWPFYELAEVRLD